MIYNLVNLMLFAMPKLLYLDQKQQAAFFLVFFILLAVFSYVLIMKSMKTFKHDENLIRGLQTKNSFLSSVLGLFFLCKYILSATLGIIFFSQLLQDYYLPNTSFWLIGVFILIPSAWLAYSGMEDRARLSECLVLFYLLPLLGLVAVAVFQSDKSNWHLLQFSIVPRFPLMEWMFISPLDFIFFSYPYLPTHKKLLQEGLYAVVFSGLILLCVLIVSMMRFPLHSILLKKQAVLQMMNSVKIPGSFFEKQDIFILCFLIISFFTLLNAYVFYSSEILGSIFDRFLKDKRKLQISFISIAIFILSFVQFQQFSLIVINVASIFSLFILPILLLLSKRWGGKK